MCGIFGLAIGEDLHISLTTLMGIVNHMFKLSESRGKEASGIAVRTNSSIFIHKEPVSASKLIRSDAYRRLFKDTVRNESFRDGFLKAPFVVLGHSRLQTNGPSEINSNNQPVLKDGAVGIHNGIIVNDEKLWRSFPALEKKYDVDTEVFLSLLQFFRRQNCSLESATRKVFGCMEGSASVALLFDDLDALLLASNTGSLYSCLSKDGKASVFASEKYILQQAIDRTNLQFMFDDDLIRQVKAGQGCITDLVTMENHFFGLGDRAAELALKTPNSHKLRTVELFEDQGLAYVRSLDQFVLREDVKQSMVESWANIYSDIDNLRRCSRCLLPETMPFIKFDDEGVCSYCRDYEARGSYAKGEKALEEFVSDYRSASGEPDCVVGFSGGRDSCFGLDYIVNHLGLHPMTFTYDWGMVNDLARRNQARVVGKLGIEHVVISADIRRKRENIRKNLKAWLRKPDLGMVPILMAGDKQFYHYFHKVRKQTGIKLFIFCGGYEAEEGTGLFKYGFCDVVTQGGKNALKRMTGISMRNKLKMMYYYIKQFVKNPAYVNGSMIDTLFAYYSSYVLPDDYVYLFHYLDWDEKRILSTITEKFDWEKETDTVATWRIDDGTAAIYNYIYMTLAGFSEFEIFRSHQIREGKLTRKQAFELIKEENRPRFKSVEWYAQAIDFDINKAIEIINSAPKLYQTVTKNKDAQLDPRQVLKISKKS